MFKSIQRAVKTYEREVERYFQMVEQVGQSVAEALGKEYKGVGQWSEDDLSWFVVKRIRLAAAAKALGLSAEEERDIWDELDPPYGPWPVVAQ